MPTALKCRAGLLSIFVMVAVAGQLYAHGRFDHVVGTVVKVEQNVLTVKTTKGGVSGGRHEDSNYGGDDIGGGGPWVGRRKDSGLRE
jgi:hypothetical protein